MKRDEFLKMLLSLPVGAGWLVKKLRISLPADCYLLNTFYVAGFQYYKGPQLIHQVKKDEKLRLAADPENGYDTFAVAITRNGEMLGHVPRSDNKHISRLLRQSLKLQCKVTEVNQKQETWEMLKVAIYL